jgi:hypothetical protein
MSFDIDGLPAQPRTPGKKTLRLRISHPPDPSQPSNALGPHETGFIPFVLQRKERSNWCWAAIAVSLGDYYGMGRFTQCGVAAAVLGTSTEADSDAIDLSNRTASLEDALLCVGCHVSWSPGRPALHDIAADIVHGRPVCVCLQWRSGDAHYVVLTGCTDHGELTVEDPLHGSSLQQFGDFPNTYRCAGTVWRGVYWTRPKQDERRT